ADEVLTLNPNTGTLPMFRTRLDADITLGIYRRHPILIRDNDPEGNPWGLSFSQGLFNMASDSHLFHPSEYFSDDEFNSWSYEREETTTLPLYEGKMLSHFDPRFSTYRGPPPAQPRMQPLPRIPDWQPDDPGVDPRARHWVERSAVSHEIGEKWKCSWL